MYWHGCSPFNSSIVRHLAENLLMSYKEQKRSSVIMKQLPGDQSMANWNTLFNEVRGLTEILEDN